ncbi:polysaccharide deacetylase family protein [Nibrella saemangeumensis]|uniref:Polysaccharide deacetylase family protein n=1 Tax=Nibrella saemangeumensis TaxID=1084526 RepID=A0ABP8MRY6_9BACT
MYHKVDPERTDRLTVTVSQLQEQLTYLQSAGYHFVPLRAVLASLASPGAALPPRSVLLTFDDGYQNNLTYVLPILQSSTIPAVVFVPTDFIGKTNEWDGSPDPLMTVDELRHLVSHGVELAYHSHQHLNYKHLTAAEIRMDLQASVTTARQLGLPLLPAFAYPYGGRPKDAASYQSMQAALREAGIQLAFRIGNRINPLPFRKPLEVNRIDVRGTDSFTAFKRKVRWGRLF